MICQTIKEATAYQSTDSPTVLPKPIHVISIDEKTSIQALEREQQRAPLSKGGQVRTESEYRRHGTTCLMGAFNVGTGKVVHDRIHPTRTEVDMALFVEDLLDKLPSEDEITLLADQLNTHKSEGVVRVIAQKMGYSGDLG